MKRERKKERKSKREKNRVCKKEERPRAIHFKNSPSTF